MMAVKSRFGLSGGDWMRLDVLSGALVVAAAVREIADKRGAKWASLGMSKPTWKRIDVASLTLVGLIALRGIIDTMEEYNVVFGKDMVFPGKGLVASTVTRFNEF